MIHRMDPPADPAREPMPEHVAPMLARAGELPRRRRRLGAMRSSGTACARSPTPQPGELRLESRNLKEITDRYPELARLNRALELARGDPRRRDRRVRRATGRPSFAALQQRMHVGSRAQAKRLAKRHAGDVHDLRPAVARRPLADGAAATSERRELLEALALSGERWQTPEHLVGDGRGAAAGERRAGPRGRRRQAPGLPLPAGRRAPASWVKIKNVGAPGARDRRLDAGRRASARARSARCCSACYEPDGALRYAGRVGSGFSEQELERLAGLLAPLQREDSPFTAGERRRASAIFVEPRLVAEVDVHASGPRRAACATPPTRGCARTRPQRGRARGRAGDERGPQRRTRRGGAATRSPRAAQARRTRERSRGAS